MRFSIWPSLAQPWDDVLAVARHADATGWDGFWAADHFMGDEGGATPVSQGVLEATGVLGAVAVATGNLRIGELVLGATYRHPAVVANWAATIDHISGGRHVLGLGAGWQVNEHRQYGIDLPPAGDLVGRFAEVLRITRSLLTEERTTFAGRWFQLDDARCEPKPVQPSPPILVGAKGDRMLGLVARWADEWNTWGLPGRLRERGAVLDRACEKIGRDPGEVGRSAQVLVLITDDKRRADDAVASTDRDVAAGPVEHLIDLVGDWRDAGVSEVVVPDLLLGAGSERLDAMDAFIEGVAPVFR